MDTGKMWLNFLFLMSFLNSYSSVVHVMQTAISWSSCNDCQAHLGLIMSRINNKVNPKDFMLCTLQTKYFGPKVLTIILLKYLIHFDLKEWTTALEILHHKWPYSYQSIDVPCTK